MNYMTDLSGVAAVNVNLLVSVNVRLNYHDWFVQYYDVSLPLDIELWLQGYFTTQQVK